MTTESILEEMKEALIKGNAPKVTECAENAIAANIDVHRILNDGLIAGMNVVGVRFKANEIYVPEVLIAARAMRAGMLVVKPLIEQAKIKEKGTVLIGTVQGDLHDIGKNLVIMMLEGGGYKVIDLGVDVSVDKLIAAVEEHKPQIVGLSALLTTTMLHMKECIVQLKPFNIKVMVGGAPLSQKFADDIGADAYAADAATAVDKANELLAMATK